MCVTSTVIDGWKDGTWPYEYPKHTDHILKQIPFYPQPGPNSIAWPIIQADPTLALQMLEVLNKLGALDKRLGMLEQCKVSADEKKKLKANLRRIARKKK